MKTETVLMLGVAALAVGVGVYLYTQKKGTVGPNADRNNPQQRNPVDAKNGTDNIGGQIGAAAAGVGSALDSLSNAFGGF